MFGGHSWDRTNDLPIKSRLLYQLSYVPVRKKGNVCNGINTNNNHTRYHTYYHYNQKGTQASAQVPLMFGEPRWGRTNDHLIKSQVLYRLS